MPRGFGQTSVQGAFRLLHPVLRAVLPRYGYIRPTEIQEKAIPLILRGNHVLIVAPTGSGKTEAALLPAMSSILPMRGFTGKIYVVYITPLRSLNRDIFARMKSLASSVGLRLEVRHGDSTELEKRRFLENPPHIMITTPESFYFLLSVEKFREAISELKYVIVDEVHELVGDKRGAELSLALERAISLYVKGKVQLVGLSATVAEPELVVRKLFGSRYVRIVEASMARKYNVGVVLPSRDNTVNGLELSEFNEELYEDTIDRIAYIANVIREKGSVIVFTNTRDTAELIGALLKKVLGENSIEVHHGSLSREHRLSIEERFRKGEIAALVATSSLELGIDIGHVGYVVQYLSPRQVVKLVQRVGRARHRAGEAAAGVVVASRNLFDVLESAVIAARTSRGNLEKLKPPHAPLDALVHQVAGTVIENPGIDIGKLYLLVTRSGFYEGLDFDEFMAVLSYMEHAGIIRIRDGKLYPGRKCMSYYFNSTMITESIQYPVYDVVSGKRIGLLDEEFVASLDVGEKFVLAGRVWEVVGFDENGVRVKPSSEDRLIPPAWEGDLIPVEHNVAREVASILRRFGEGHTEVLDMYPLSDTARRYVGEKLLQAMRELGFLPHDRRILVEHYGDTYVVYVFLGSRGNKSLEYLLAYYISQIKGYNVLSASTPYAIVLKLPERSEPGLVEMVIKRLAELPPSTLEEMYVEAVKKSRLYSWILYRVAQRAGALPASRRARDPSMLKRVVAQLANTILGVEALREFENRKGNLEVVKALLRDVGKGYVLISTVSRRNPSPLTEDIISEALFSDRVVRTQMPATLVAEAVKRRIKARQVILICLVCGYKWQRRVSELPQEIKCPNCSSKLVYVTTVEEKARDASMLAMKRKRVGLSRSENKRMREYIEVANLVMDYGRYAVEALVARGVGVSTARRVLQKLVFSEDAFYKALVEAEAKYYKYAYKLRKK
ncbi:DEAD/DEAH box helicase [Hyperthermus butylicus]|uniref:DEAD/DEAH box helicase n=1 Tax=Hyperthermus butylicus (strain DSM 5456 / JCM 9403 / PLM1-5) TaxID=415426 RepID=A2BMA9_HYPBU|nr:DEAD/DEAH box helicase [Hyperthermus butylicus]ABM81120.1 DEAD/DEAH box helicase [Hyperthermus butylicus DSM 5456]